MSAAIRYAKALLDLAQESKVEDAAEELLSEFSAVLSNSEGVGDFLLSPAIASEKRRQVLDKIIASAFPKGETAVLISNFLRLLMDKGRLAALPEVLTSYKEQRDAQGGRLRGELTSASPLTEEEVAAVQRKLEESLGKKVELTMAVDTDLLAGVIAQVGDLRIDGSLRTRLKNLTAEITRG